MHLDADYDADNQYLRMDAPGSSGSLGFEEFEAYARRELPQMVEAGLWAQIYTNNAPTTEAIRALLAEFLLSCQSMVAENFRSIGELGTDTPNILQGSSASGIYPVPSEANVPLGDWELPILTTTKHPQTLSYSHLRWTLEELGLMNNRCH